MKVHQYIALLAMLPPDLEMRFIADELTGTYERIDEPQTRVAFRAEDGRMYAIKPDGMTSEPQLIISVT